MIVLITGISSGFGQAMARRLSADGHTVYGTVRRDVEPIEGVRYLKCDVRDEEAVTRTVSTVLGAEGRIDVLITNAGMGIGGPIEFNTYEEIRTQMDTNFMGQVRFIKAALPHMRGAGAGHIICLSSIGGLMGLPFQGFYSASKFAIEGLCESLRLELRHTGVKVTVIEPGDFATGFTASRLKTSVSDEAATAYPSMHRAVESFEKDETGGLRPEHLACKVSRIIRYRHPRYRYVISTFEQRLSTLLKRLLPDSWFASILASYYKL